jgi:hypothetical protein
VTKIVSFQTYKVNKELFEILKNSKRCGVNNDFSKIEELKNTTENLISGNFEVMNGEMIYIVKK